MIPKIAKATGIVIFILAVGSILSYFKIVIFADKFGVSFPLDAYLLALIIPTLLGVQLADGFTAAVVPVLSKYAKREEKDYFISGLVNIIFLTLFLITAVLLLVTPFLSSLIAPGLKGESLTLVITLMRLLLLTIIFNGLIGVLRGVLHFAGNFALPSSFFMIRDFSIIAFIWILANRIGITAAAYGNLAGSLIGFFLLTLAIFKEKVRYHPILDFRHAGIKEVGKLMIPIVGIISFTQGNIYVDRVMATLLPGEGNISALTYGDRMVQIPIVILVSALATVFFPFFSQLVGEKDKTGFQKTLSLSLRLVLLLIIPAISGLIVLRVPLVHFLFEHGMFTERDTQAVSTILLYYSGGIISLSLIYILMKAYYALKKVKTLLKVVLTMFFSNIIFNFILMKYLGVRGLALSTSLILTLGMGLLLWFLKEYLGPLERKKIVITLSKISISSLLMIGGCFYFLKRLTPLTFYTLLEIILLGMGIYVVILFLLKTREIKSLWSLIRKKQYLNE